MPQNVHSFRSAPMDSSVQSMANLLNSMGGVSPSSTACASPTTTISACYSAVGKINTQGQLCADSSVKRPFLVVDSRKSATHGVTITTSANSNKAVFTTVMVPGTSVSIHFFFPINFLQ